MKIIKKPLPNTEYNKLEYEKYGMKTKTHIVLHHTVSATESSVFNWWSQDGVKVAVAYVIDKDGTVYEYFDPKYWSYHLGGKISKIHNINSIGIELVNEGCLTKLENDFYWFNNKNKYVGEVYEFNWRNNNYWAKYSNKQFDSLVQLLKLLTIKFNIPAKVCTHLNYDINLLKKFCGIISHCNVRADKTDISPALNLNLLQQKLGE